MTKTNLEIEEEFDEKFGKDGEERNCDSTGRLAGCDDCSSNIELRAEHKAFLISKLQQRMDEIVGEVKALKSYQKQYSDGSVDSPKIDRGDVLNIIKSVDKK